MKVIQKKLKMRYNKNIKTKIIKIIKLLIQNNKLKINNIKITIFIIQQKINHLIEVKE